jgi:uncharacterized Zn finger protein
MSAVKLTLDNFRTEMDEKVLERGWFYFSKGWVKGPKEVLPDFYESVVNEVVPHAISYSIDEDSNVDDVFCTCGEDPWCRHLAAVLFRIEEERNSRMPVNEHITE